MTRSWSGAEEAGAPPLAVLTPLLERWRVLLASAVLAGALALAIIFFLVPRRYDASATLAAVASTKLPTGLGGLAALSGLAGETGFTATPDLFAQLLQSRRVLLAVALEPVRAGDPERVIDRVRAHQDSAKRLVDVERSMRELVNVGVERRTGLITLSVQHRDSAIARHIGARLIDVASGTFAEISKAQASAQREAQEERVERLSDRLRSAERQLIAFLAGNRALNPYSPASAEQQRLEREIGVASQAYTQAVGEREVALARELSETPALVIVDPIPAELAPVSRKAAFYALAAAFLGLFLAATALAFREVVRQHRERDDPTSRRFVAAVEGIPLVGRSARERKSAADG